MRKLLVRLARCVHVSFLKMQGVKVGKNCMLSPFCRIDTSYPNLVEIGDECCITHGAVILGHDYSLKRVGRSTIEKGKTVLKRNVFVGANAVVLPGITVGENSVIAAAAVVTRDVPPNVIVAGNPAKIIRQLATHE